MSTHPEGAVQLPRLSSNAITIVAATLLEYVAIRSVLPRSRLSLCGVGLARRYPTTDRPIIVCGLAGSLIVDLQPGEVVVPESVCWERGEIAPCDGELVQALQRGARLAGHEPRPGRLLTAASIVTGSSRAAWANRGFDLADMETAHLIATGRRVATIRVILDSPSCSIAPDWLDPHSAILRPQLWREGLWLAGAALRYALRAAVVLRAALASLDALP